MLSDNVPLSMQGIWTSQSTLAASFGARVQPTTYLFALRHGLDPKATAKRLESAFLADGMQADALNDILHDAVASSLTFDRLIMGFMGLGLIVGVAALGVISTRSVVERRQHRRAARDRLPPPHGAGELPDRVRLRRGNINPRRDRPRPRRRIQRIADSQRQGTFQNLGFHVPWITLAVIFTTVFLIAMATTLLPARRAARVYPAEALRYQ